MYENNSKAKHSLEFTETRNFSFCAHALFPSFSKYNQSAKPTLCMMVQPTGKHVFHSHTRTHQIK
jgi:hypothetical protein